MMISHLKVVAGSSICRNGAVVTVWVSASAGRLCVVATVRAVRSVVAVHGRVDLSVVVSLVIRWVVVLDEASAVTTSDGRAGVGGVVRWTEVVVVGCGEGSGWNTSTDGTKLGILLGVLVLATEETATSAGAGGVVVVWRWAEALLLLVVTNKGDLHERCEDEEDSADNRDGESSGVEFAGKAKVWEVSGVLAATESETIGAVTRTLVAGWSVSERCLNVAFAAVGAVAGQDGHGDKGTNHANIKNDCKETEEADATKAASQEDSKDGVNAGNARKTLNSLLPSCDGQVAVGEDRKKVGVDTQDDAGAAEAEKVEECLQQALEASFDDGHVEDL